MRCLNSWLERIEQFHPNEIEFGLERVKQVAQKLDLLNPSGKVILVGGTNGKGSCVATLESMARVNGLSFGCYTSPHLIKFNERIRINGSNVSDQLLVEAFEAIEKQRAEVALTFFEVTTLAALYCFSSESLELLVLEIGLGGRLDAVNIIEPNASVITTIDKDHEAWLGSDLLSVAREKAGIYRTGKFNLVGDQKSLKLLAEIGASQEFSLRLAGEYVANEYAELDLAKTLSDLTLNPYRLLKQNVECAVAAFTQLYPNCSVIFRINQILSNIEINGRLQRLCDSPLTLLDVGHNEQSAINLASQLETYPEPKLRVAVCGLMADKAIDRFLAALEAQIDYWIFVDLPGERAASACELNQIYQFIKRNGHSEIASSVATGYQLALANSEKDKQILVIGSFVTVAEMLHYYQKT